MFPASERLEFMRKYSLPPFSQKLGNAVDMWCEAAVLVKTRKQLTSIFEAVNANTYRLPLRVRDVMDRIREELPTELLSYNPVFLPLAQNPTAEALKLSRSVRLILFISAVWSHLIYRILSFYSLIILLSYSPILLSFPPNPS